MAQIREHRTHPRTYCRIPLDCLSKQSDQSFHATVFNLSDDGVYLETDHVVRPGENILIHAAQEVPEEVACKEFEDNVGIIRWSSYMEQGEHHLFGAGVKFYYPDMMEDLKEVRGLTYYCDMCGRTIRFTDVQQSKGIIWMCPRCNAYVENLPKALNETTSRFLIGNVL